jgi:hypothetical protein
MTRKSPLPELFRMKSRISCIAATYSTPYFIKSSKRYDNLCLISAVHHLYSSVGSLLNIGAERFSLLRFDGTHQDSSRNMGERLSQPLTAHMLRRCSTLFQKILRMMAPAVPGKEWLFRISLFLTDLRMRKNLQRKYFRNL